MDFVLSLPPDKMGHGLFILRTNKCINVDYGLGCLYVD